MTHDTWSAYTNVLVSLLAGTSVSDADGNSVATDDGFTRWKEITVSLRKDHHTIFLIGNGASASMASHFAADLTKNANVATQVFSDLSLMTAMSNDIGYEHVYADPLRRCAKTGDMLVSISSSGKSPNILAAAKLGADVGMSMVTLTGMDGDNPLRRTGLLNFYVSAIEYGMTETAHAAILHHWMDSVEI